MQPNTLLPPRDDGQPQPALRPRALSGWNLRALSQKKSSCIMTNCWRRLLGLVKGVRRRLPHKALFAPMHVIPDQVDFPDVLVPKGLIVSRGAGAPKYLTHPRIPGLLMTPGVTGHFTHMIISGVSDLLEVGSAIRASLRVARCQRQRLLQWVPLRSAPSANRRSAIPGQGVCSLSSVSLDAIARCVKPSRPADARAVMALCASGARKSVVRAPPRAAFIARGIGMRLPSVIIIIIVAPRLPPAPEAQP